MKALKTILLFTIVMSQILVSYCQTMKDTKDFIIEKIEANEPLSNYDYAVFFQNISRDDAEEFAGRKLTDDEFGNLFICAREVYLGKNMTGGVAWLAAYVIDIRGITKVSTSRYTGEPKSMYLITVYLSDDYPVIHFVQTSFKTEHKKILKMELSISDNSEIAQKIKRAIIHLGTLHGVSVRDGDDLF